PEKSPNWDPVAVTAQVNMTLVGRFSACRSNTSSMAVSVVAWREINGVMRTSMTELMGGPRSGGEGKASPSAGRPARNQNSGWIGGATEPDMSWQTSRPLPLSIGWRGGQGERSCTCGGLTPVPPLHPMERGPGGEVECAHPRKIYAKKQQF